MTQKDYSESSISMQERDQREQHDRYEPYRENPTMWTGGDTFRVALHEATKENGRKELTLQVFDGKECVIVQFADSVRSSHTLFLSEETAPPLPQEQPQLATPRPETPVQTPTVKETENRPAKLSGTITTVGALTETKKKKQPMLLFTFHDEVNNVERRAIAFDTIAQRLAAPDTALQPQEPITIYAWKHENTVHIGGKERTVEDWYVQKAVYHGTVFEKPRSPSNRRNTTR